jgi:HSP20 family molecular chaperone IbpA
MIFATHRNPMFSHPSEVGQSFIAHFLSNLVAFGLSWLVASVAFRLALLVLSLLLSPVGALVLILAFIHHGWSNGCSSPPQSSILRHPGSRCFFFGPACQSGRGFRAARHRHCCNRTTDDKTKATETVPEKDEPPKKNNEKTEEVKEEKNTRRTIFQNTPFYLDENEKEATISVDIAGFDVSNIHIKMVVDNGFLQVSGERRNKLGDTFVFQRRFALDKALVKKDEIKANFSDSVLKITVPKREAPKPRLISITAHTVENENEQDAPKDKDKEKATEQEDVPPANEGIYVETVEEEIVFFEEAWENVTE